MMRVLFLRVLFLFCFAVVACAFQLGIPRKSSFLSMTSTHKIDIVTRDLTLTDTLKARVESKIGKVIDKLGYTGIVSTNLVLRVHKNPTEEIHASTTKKDSQIAEVTVKLKGNQVIHCTERTEDMYASIDILSHKLALKMKRVKDKVENCCLCSSCTRSFACTPVPFAPFFVSEPKMFHFFNFLFLVTWVIRRYKTNEATKRLVVV